MATSKKGTHIFTVADLNMLFDFVKDEANDDECIPQHAVDTYTEIFIPLLQKSMQSMIDDGNKEYSETLEQEFERVYKEDVQNLVDNIKDDAIGRLSDVFDNYKTNPE